MTIVRMFGTTVGKTGSAPPDPPPNSYPLWRYGKPVNAWFKIPATANMAGATNAVSDTIDLWNGLASSPDGRFYSVLASGDGKWRNAVHKIDLNVDAPAWTTLDSGATDPAGVYRHASPPSNGSPAVIDQPYYEDGKPCGRHTYSTTFFLPTSQSPDGHERIFVLTSQATYGINAASPTFDHGPQVDSFKLESTNAWDAAGTWTSHPNQSLYADFAQDPRTGYIFTVGSGGDQFDSWYYKWVAGSWVKISITPRYPDTGRILEGTQQGSLIDASRNRLVLMHDGRPYDTSRGARMYWVNLSNATTTIKFITGDLPAVWGNDQSVVHDTTADKYYFFLQRNPFTDVYSIDPVTGVSTKTHTIASSPIFEGIVRRIAYFSNLGGIAYLPRYDDNIWFLPTV